MNLFIKLQAPSASQLKLLSEQKPETQQIWETLCLCTLKVSQKLSDFKDDLPKKELWKLGLCSFNFLL